MQDLKVTTAQFDPLPNWTLALKTEKPLIPFHVDLFDQNGYDLTMLEEMYASRNMSVVQSHRTHRKAIRQKWMVQRYKEEGAVLNHALLFERKGFAGSARKQLEEWAKLYPCYHKHLNQKPKWGLDFSIDFYDRGGRTFEVLHWEYDSFDYNEIVEQKARAEKILLNIDWDDAAERIWALRDEWYNLDFFKQSDFKCNFFGIGPERWKMVVW